MGEIRSITIRRFKRLESITFGLDLGAVFIGGNNSGKSSILQALHYAVSVAQSARLVCGDRWNADVYTATFRPDQLIYTPTVEVMSLGHNREIREPRATWVEIEIGRSDGNRCLVAIGRGRNGNIAVRMEGKELGERIQDISRPYTVYVPGLAGISRQETFLSQGVVRRVVARGDANLVLRNVLFWLFQREKDWERFQNDMRELFPELSIRVSFTDITDEHIRISFSTGGGSRELPLESAGTGILQATQVLAYIALFSPQLLLLDEPDSHMHPNNQAAMCKLLTLLAGERNFQFVIATHSRHVLTAVREVVPISWIRGGALIEGISANVTKCLLEIGALDSLDYLGHPELRCLVLTEDSDEALLKAILEASGFDMARTKVLSYHGCSNIDVVRALGELLRERAPHLRLLVHRDRDYLSDEGVNRYREMTNELDCAAFVTEFSDIEGYFLNPEHLHSLYPTLTIERATELLDQVTAVSREESIRDIINLRMERAWKMRARGGENPNAGQVALEAAREYDANPGRMRRGKRVFGRLKGLLQQELAENPRLERSSPALRLEPLRLVAEAIWPPAAE